MAELFDRRATLTVGLQSWSGLRVVFRVAPTVNNKPNPADLQIYNLSETGRAAVSERGAAVRLSAGYAGTGEQVLFTGQVIYSTHDRPGPDWVTTIVAADGDAQWSKYISKVYRGSTSARTVVRALADAMGIAVPATALAALSAQQLDGVAMHGLAHRELETVLRSAGFEWSIQGGVLQILRKGAATLDAPILLSPSSGLIGVPSIAYATKKRDLRFYTDPSKAPPLPAATVTATSLLQPGLRPGRLVEIQASQAAGRYRVESVVHTGDTHGSAWHSEIKAKGVN